MELDTKTDKILRTKQITINLKQEDNKMNFIYKIIKFFGKKQVVKEPIVQIPITKRIVGSKEERKEIRKILERFYRLRHTGDFELRLHYKEDTAKYSYLLSKANIIGIYLKDEQ